VLKAMMQLSPIKWLIQKSLVMLMQFVLSEVL
jgi:hypothetical protein